MIDNGSSPNSLGPRIFRAEACSAKVAAHYGTVKLAQPLVTLFCALLACGLAIAFVSFLTLGNLTRNARVSGITMPLGGMMTIAAPIDGIIARTLVREGQSVRQGEPLLEILSDRQVAAGSTSKLIAEQLKIRKDALLAERDARVVQSRNSQRVIQQRLDNFAHEMQAIDQEESSLQRKIDLGQKTVRKFQSLQASGFLSEQQVQQKQEDLIDLRLRVSTLHRARLHLIGQRITVESEREAENSALGNALAQLYRADSLIQQEMAENQDKYLRIAVAPKAGLVGALHYVDGQSVKQGQSIATLLGRHSSTSKEDSLEVLLFARSRLVGFVRTGQKVLIRYQAYPYQKFGLQQGIVAEVSKTPSAPGELPPVLAGSILANVDTTRPGTAHEALYRIRVTLKTQSIVAYGKSQPLQAGMTVDADIVQDKRAIWEWIAEPLLSAWR